MDRVVVAGGGLAGLVAARHLAASGAEVTVYERRDRVGGRVRSRRESGFVLDRGFQVLFTGYPAVERELDVDALDLREFAPGAVICSAADGTRATLSDPLRDPGAALESALNRRVTTGDKLRTLRLRRALRRRPEGSFFAGDDTTIRNYLRDRGFSDRYLEAFVAPFYGGITLDRSLSTASDVFAYTFRALSAGRIGVPADGMGAVPEQLAAHAREAGAEIETGVAVETVEPDGDGVAVETGAEAVGADAAVVATDPPTARALTGVDAVPTAGRGCVTQYYALSDDSPLETGRKLLLNADDGYPNTVAPLSHVAPEYAPDGRQLLSATFVDEAALEADAAELAAETRAALDGWYPERSFGGLELVETDRIRFAQFDQPPGVHADLPTVDAPDGPVYLAGDYTEWSSIQGAMESGRRAAEAVRADLG